VTCALASRLSVLPRYPSSDWGQVAIRRICPNIVDEADLHWHWSAWTGIWVWCDPGSVEPTSGGNAHHSPDIGPSMSRPTVVVTENATGVAREAASLVARPTRS
jgi:hypothetical protein